MFWALPLGMAALGALNGANQAKQQKAANLAQAEMTRYSPWTGMKGQITPRSSSMLGGAMQGAGTGLAMMQGMGGSSAQPATPNGIDQPLPSGTTGTMTSRLRNPWGLTA